MNQDSYNQAKCLLKNIPNNKINDNDLKKCLETRDITTCLSNLGNLSFNDIINLVNKKDGDTCYKYDNNKCSEGVYDSGNLKCIPLPFYKTKVGIATIIVGIILLIIIIKLLL
jgi:hypothetical protein